MTGRRSAPRAPIRWPGSARVALCVIVNLEHMDWLPPEAILRRPERPAAPAVPGRHGHPRDLLPRLREPRWRLPGDAGARPVRDPGNRRHGCGRGDGLPGPGAGMSEAELGVHRARTRPEPDDHRTDAGGSGEAAHTEGTGSRPAGVRGDSTGLDRHGLRRVDPHGAAAGGGRDTLCVRLAQRRAALTA